MLLKAPYDFRKYVETSGDFLGCPNITFNEHLNSTYRQFVSTLPKDSVVKHIAILLHTFGETKTNAVIKAIELYEFYQSISHAEFNKLNIDNDSYKDGIPKAMLAIADKINEACKKVVTYGLYGKNVKQGSWDFVKGYKLKVF